MGEGLTERSHTTFTTPLALMETCRLLWRQEHALPQVAMGTGVDGELSGHRRLCFCPGLNAPGRTRQHTQKARLKDRTPLLPACYGALNPSLLPQVLSTKEIQGGNYTQNRRQGGVKDCVREIIDW